MDEDTIDQSQMLPLLWVLILAMGFSYFEFSSLRKFLTLDIEGDMKKKKAYKLYGEMLENIALRHSKEVFDKLIHAEGEAFIKYNFLVGEFLKKIVLETHQMVFEDVDIREFVEKNISSKAKDIEKVDFERNNHSIEKAKEKSMSVVSANKEPENNVSNSNNSKKIMLWNIDDYIAENSVKNSIHSKSTAKC